MADAAASFAPLLSNLELWVGLVITLFTFSLVLGDNALARLALHLVVGASLGYATLMAFHYVVNLRIFIPLSAGQSARLAAPLILAGVLLAAGGERIFSQGRTDTRDGHGRRTLQVAGVVPLAILIGVGLAAGVAGLVQGTLVAQARAVVTETFAAGRVGAPLWSGVMTLLLTTATLLALTLDRRIHVEPLPRPLRDLLQVWLWVGERALWIVSGVLLARLFAARLPLLVDRIDAVLLAYQTSGVRAWIEQWVQTWQG